MKFADFVILRTALVVGLAAPCGAEAQPTTPQKIAAVDTLIVSATRDKSLQELESALDAAYEAHHPIPEARPARRDLAACYLRVLAAIEQLTNPKDLRPYGPVPLMSHTPEGIAAHEKDVKEMAERRARAEFQIRLKGLRIHGDGCFSMMISHLYDGSPSNRSELAELIRQSALSEEHQTVLRAKVAHAFRQ